MTLQTYLDQHNVAETKKAIANLVAETLTTGAKVDADPYVR